MAEQEATGSNGSGAKEPVAPQMQILAQYVRDMSFENILVQKGLSAEGQPDVQVGVSLDAKKRQTEGQFEILLKLKVTSKEKDGEAVFFVMELEYGGVFLLNNVPEEQMHPFLLIECPRMLFPYVRRIVSDVTRDGGFPPLNLENIDFVALYRQELTRRAQAQAEQTPQA
ncbi:MAG: protein-export chaperone SecB [Pseudomonadota bacterium]